MSDITKEVPTPARAALVITSAIAGTVAGVAFGARTLLSQPDTVLNLVGVAVVLVWIYAWIFWIPKWIKSSAHKKVTVTPPKS